MEHLEVLVLNYQQQVDQAWLHFAQSLWQNAQVQQILTMMAVCVLLLRRVLYNYVLYRAIQSQSYSLKAFKDWVNWRLFTNVQFMLIFEWRKPENMRLLSHRQLWRLPSKFESRKTRMVVHQIISGSVFSVSKIYIWLGSTSPACWKPWFLAPHKPDVELHFCNCRARR